MTNRRTFFRGTGAGLLILPSARTALAYKANEQFNFGVVGMRGYGAYHGFAGGIHLYDNCRYGYSCDVDLRKVAKAYDFWRGRAALWARSEKEHERQAVKDHYARLAKTPPPLFKDFRVMLDQEADNIDAVVVATPDHTHANIAAAALRAGKPVFAEKPLTISAHEARALAKLARQTGLPTQMNNHGASKAAFRRAVEIIREGHLGDIEQVHIFFRRGGRDFKHHPQDTEPIPKELEWDLWLAQLPWRGYHPDWINRIGWRGTSIGELGNFGPHSANMAFMGLNVKDLWGTGNAPIRITAEAASTNHISYPRWERIHWKIPARGQQRPVTFTWHHGPKAANDYAPGTRKMLSDILRQHGAAEPELAELLPDAGCLILGSKGLIATNSHNTRFKLLPEKNFADLEQTKPLSGPLSPGHYQEWVQAAQGRDDIKPISSFEYAAPFAEFLNAGSIATRFAGDELEFIPHQGKITNHEKANALLTYEYREGWTI